MEASHAYSADIGQNVGILIDGIGIVSGTIMTPDVGMDDNFVNVQTEDGTWHVVRYMDTYRADFVNASLATEELFTCGYCGGIAHFDDEKLRYVHAFAGERVNATSPGDFVSYAHNQAGTVINPVDLIEGE